LPSKQKAEMAVRDNRDEVLDRYLKQRKGHGLSQGQLADMELDPIDEHLVARIVCQGFMGQPVPLQNGGSWSRWVSSWGKDPLKRSIRSHRTLPM
jgi:hypothetical protein